MTLKLPLKKQHHKHKQLGKELKQKMRVNLNNNNPTVTALTQIQVCRNNLPHADVNLAWKWKDQSM